MKLLPVTEADLHAYVDGLLPVARAAEIAAYLEAHPVEQHRLQAYREQNKALLAMFNPVLDEALPDALRPAALAACDTPLSARAAYHSKAWRWQNLAAGAAIALISGSAGWLLHGADEGTLYKVQQARSSLSGVRNASTLAHQAAIAHAVYSPDLRRPVEIAADQEEQLVAWLTKRIGDQIRPPKLGRLGYELIGGRLLPGESGPVAQFMYQDSGGQRLTLYVASAQLHKQDSGFKFSQEGQLQVFYWIDGKFGYALSAGINKAELAKIATVVYQQLTP